MLTAEEDLGKPVENLVFFFQKAAVFLLFFAMCKIVFLHSMVLQQKMFAVASDACCDCAVEEVGPAGRAGGCCMGRPSAAVEEEGPAGQASGCCMGRPSAAEE